MLARSNGAKIWNNNFSFLSGLGIALYRASGNTIQHNKVDWCVRGYSHTFYNRGQDSAGILIYEQSNKNIVAFNSVDARRRRPVPVGGAVDDGYGGRGRERQRVLRQRFQLRARQRHRSHLQPERLLRQPHRGELARDLGRLQLRLVDRGEQVREERRGHRDRARPGQPDHREPVFDGDEIAIRLWKNPTQDPNWGYAKRRDTRSRDYVIAGNTFVGTPTALKVTETQNVRVLTNVFEKVGTVAVLMGDTRNFGVGDEVAVPIRPRSTLEVTLPKALPGGMDAKIPDAERRGREAIIVDDWGPVRLEISEAVAGGTVGCDAPETARPRASR